MSSPTVTRLDNLTELEEIFPKKLKIEFGFGIGKKKNGDQIPLYDLKDGLDRIKAFAATRFSGYTLIPGSGGWTSPRGDLVEENCMTLIVYVATTDLRVRREINGTVDAIKRALDQEAVAVCITPVLFDIY